MARYNRLYRALAVMTLLVPSMLCNKPVAAQSVALPPGCAGKTGDALRDCVRDSAPAETAEQEEPLSKGEEATRLTDCPKAYNADRPFCLHRNRVLIECRRHDKYPDFNACFQHYMAHAPVPGDEPCTGKDAARRTCERRNATHVQCRADPLRYFSCLGQALPP